MTRRSGAWLLAGLVVAAAAALAVYALRPSGKPPAPGPPVPSDDEVIAAWREAGLRFGWYGRDAKGVHHFRDKRGSLDRPLPAFRATERDLKWLPPLPNLSRPFALDLGGTEVTDAALKELRGLSSLTELGLGNTKVTDAGLKELAGLGKLTSLDLTDTEVTDKGVKALEKALPKCKVIR